MYAVYLLQIFNLCLFVFVFLLLIILIVCIFIRMYARQAISSVIGTEILNGYISAFEKLSKKDVCSLSFNFGGESNKDGRIPYLQSVFGKHHEDLLPAFGTLDAIIENMSICFGCSLEMCERLKEVCNVSSGKTGLQILDNDKKTEVYRFINDEITRYLADNVEIKFDLDKLLEKITGKCSCESLIQDIGRRKKERGEDIYTVLFRDPASPKITCIIAYSVKRRLFVRDKYEVIILYHVTTPNYKPRGKDVMAKLVQALHEAFEKKNVHIETDSTLGAAKYWYGNGFVCKHWIPEQLQFWDWNPWDPQFKYLERGKELKREHYPFGQELFGLYLKHADALTMTTEEFKNCYYVKPPFNSFVTVGDSHFMNKNTKSSIGSFFLIYNKFKFFIF